MNLKRGFTTKSEMLENSHDNDTVFIQSKHEKGYRLFYSFGKWYDVYDILPMYNDKVYAYEIIKFGKPCKPYLDIEYDNLFDIVKDDSQIKSYKVEFCHTLKQNIVNIFKNSYAYELTPEYIFISDSSAMIDDKYKLSFHVTITTPDQVLYDTNTHYGKNSAFHLAKLLSEKAEYTDFVDLNVYTKDREMRLLCSWKSSNDLRQLLPISHDTIYTKNMVSKYIITWYNLNKPYKILETPQELRKRNNRNIPIKNSIVTHKNNSEVENLLELIFKYVDLQIDQFKKYVDSDKIIYYYISKCIACNKIHKRKDSPNITISSTLHNLIEISFKCWNNNKSHLKFFITRNNTQKIRCNKQMDSYYLKNFMSSVKKNMTDIYKIVKLLTFNVVKNIQIKDDAALLTDNTIDKDYLTAYDIYSICIMNIIKSYEETNKTGAMIDITAGIQNKDEKYKDDHDKKIIIVACNTATLGGIKGRFEDYNKNNDKKIEFTWYKGVSNEVFLNGDFKVLLTTQNSLYKFLNENNEINNPSQYILWNDETNATIQYTTSTTLPNRLNVLTALYQLIKNCHKAYFTCADLTKNIVDLLLKTRKGTYNIVQNIHTKKHRIYNGIVDFSYFIEKLELAIKYGERIAVLCDSRRKSEYYYFMLCHIFAIYKIKEKIKTLESLPNSETTNKQIEMFNRMIKIEEEYYKIISVDSKISKKVSKQINDRYTKLYKDILLINRDNNNDVDTLANINQIIKQNKVCFLVCSPSLGIGVSVDLKNDDNTPYFDRLFAHLTGKSLTAKATQQMFNRIRHFTYTDHYIFLDNINKKFSVTDVEINSKVINDIKKYHDKIITELRLKHIDKNDNDFMHDIYVRAIVDRNISDNDFLSELIKAINNRGHTFNLITSCSTKIKANNKKEKKKMYDTIEVIEAFNTEDIIKSRLITDDKYKKYTNKSINGFALNDTQKKEIKKFLYYKKYHVKDDIDQNDMIKFINDIDGDKLYNNLMNFNKFVMTTDKQYDVNEIDDINIKNIEKHKIVNKLLQNIGFENGVLSNNIIKEIEQFDITDEENNKIRVLFRNDGDTGRLRSETKDTHKLTLWISRLINSMYGITISYDNIVKRVNGKIIRINENYCINYNDLYKDYLVLKYSQKVETLPFEKDVEFKFSHIHGINGTYEQYIKSKNEAKYMFIEDNNNIEQAAEIENPLDHCINTLVLAFD